MSDDDPIERIHFSDAELAFLRHARFGELPPRIPSQDRVESIETEPRRDGPQPLVWPGAG